MKQDFKQLILSNLYALRDYEKEQKQYFKAKAYSKVIQEIEKITIIKNIDDIKTVPGVGKSIIAKLEELFQTGTIKKVEAISEKSKLKSNAVTELTRVMNIGDKKASELFDKHNITSIEMLRLNQHLLNEKQLLGLKYVEQFEKRIPRHEMNKHKDLIANIMDTLNKERNNSNQIQWHIAGSYRRNAKDSGDIDVLVSCENSDNSFMQNMIDSLKETKYIVDTFACGNDKFMGACRLFRHRTVRRIDILFVPPDRMSFALLYFTGSQEFNICLRKYALSKGYSLSEHGLKFAKGAKKGEFVIHKFKEEDDIFQFLGMNFIQPEKRSKDCLKYILHDP